MAIQILYHGFVLPTQKPRRKVSMQHSSQLPAKKPSTLLTTYSPLNKVFEDHSRGIICYRTESGEMICEGYDEGPRLQKSHQREFKMNDVERRWYSFVKDNGLLLADKGSSVLGELEAITLEDYFN